VKVIAQALFDPKTDGFVRDLWQRTKQAGLPNPLLSRNAAPCMTLASAEGVSIDPLLNDLDDALKACTSLNFLFNTLSTFANENGVIFLGPIVTQNLLDLHKLVYKQVAKYAETVSMYSEPDRWFPHCTITWKLEKPQVFEGLKLFDDLHLPFEARITKVALFNLDSRAELAHWALR
jgi:2'-5' RNA ligase